MSALLKLRDYQTEAIAELHRRWDAGDTRVPMVLATGLGKTVIFAHLIADWTAANAGKRVIVLVHTDELVQQAYKKIKDVAPKLTVGIVKAERNEVTARVIVASVQSLRSAKRRSQIRNVGLIIVDECFPAGTMVGDKRIEDLKPGDLVPSWDERTGEAVMRPVVRLMKKVPSGMVRVSMSDGTSFACTPNHPILTSGGWQLAGWLSPGESVVSFTHDATAIDSVHGVFGAGDSDGEGEDRHVPPIRADVLYGRVPGRVGEAGSVGQDGAHEPQACVHAHEGAQPDGSPGGTREDGGHAEADQSSTSLAWREWFTSPSTSREAGSASRLAHRGHRRAEGRRDAVALQGGHRAPDDEGTGGGGWGIPLLTGAPVLRSSQGRTSVTTRVVDVQVLEPGRDGTYGGVCPDGLVYNIEVADTHTYLIGDGVVVHNCHHATAATYRAILEHYRALPPSPDRPVGLRDIGLPKSDVVVAGFTATLARGDKAKLSDIWQECTFKRGIAFGIRRGYLLDVRGKRIVIPEMDLGNVKKSGGDYAEGSLAAELDRSLAPSIVADAYAAHAATRKGLGFAPTVESAHHFADAFNEAGVTSAVVHGGTPREERRLILKRLRAGDVRVVWNCGVLTEGFDEPTVSCIVMARPTKSAPLYQQIVGRGLRPDLSLAADQRGDCLVLDVVGASGRHDLRTLVDLSSHPERAADLELDDLSLLEMEDDLEILQREEEAPGSVQDEEYYGETVAQDFDPLNRTGIGAWLQTDGGIYFLPAGNQAYVLLVPSEEPGLFDVAWLTQAPGIRLEGQYADKQGDLTEHRALHLDMACSWAEEVLEEIGGDAGIGRADARERWRRSKAVASPRWQRLAISHGIPVTGHETRSELSDRIDTVLGSRRIDPVVQFMTAARGELG